MAVSLQKLSSIGLRKTEREEAVRCCIKSHTREAVVHRPITDGCLLQETKDGCEADRGCWVRDYKIRGSAKA